MLRWDHWQFGARPSWHSLQQWPVTHYSNVFPDAGQGRSTEETALQADAPACHSAEPEFAALGQNLGWRMLKMALSLPIGTAWPTC